MAGFRRPRAGGSRGSRTCTSVRALYGRTHGVCGWRGCDGRARSLASGPSQLPSLEDVHAHTNTRARARKCAHTDTYAQRHTQKRSTGGGSRAGCARERGACGSACVCSAAQARQVPFIKDCRRPAVEKGRRRLALADTRCLCVPALPSDAPRRQGEGASGLPSR